MKKFLFTLAMMVMAIGANAQEAELTVGNLVIDEGIGMLDVSFKSDYDIVGWQMSIVCPDGLVPLQGDLNDRYPKNKLKKFYHTVGFTEATDGSYLVVCYAQDATNNAIADKEGVLVTILFDAEGYTGTAEDAEITIKNFAVALADATQVTIDEEVTTGIEFVVNDKTMNADGTIYNLSGQRVQKTGKGLYIQNGKKVVVK